MDNGKHGGSFRDPNGFIYYKDGCLYRQVNTRYREDFDLLIGSGLYGELASAGLLVEHDEVDLSLAAADNA